MDYIEFDGIPVRFHPLMVGVPFWEWVDSYVMVSEVHQVTGLIGFMIFMIGFSALFSLLSIKAYRDWRKRND